MTHLADHAIYAAPLRKPPSARRTPASVRCRDARWPAVAAALAALRAARRRSVRIVDADCGAGGMLLCAVRHARALGFVAIEARGIDAAPVLIGRARAAAAALADPAIGLTFDTGNAAAALRDERDFPADIVVWHGRAVHDQAVTDAIAAAGRTVIDDSVATKRAAA